jgi:hypothetical protein
MRPGPPPGDSDWLAYDLPLVGFDAMPGVARKRTVVTLGCCSAVMRMQPLGGGGGVERVFSIRCQG